MATSTPTKMTKMTLEVPEQLHRTIKAVAAARGQSMRDFVIERLAEPAEEYDMDDINVAIAEALQDVTLHREGKIKLQTLDDALKESKKA